MHMRNMRASHTLLAIVCGCGIPLGLSGAPSTLVAPPASAVLQLQPEQRSRPDSTDIRSQAEDAQGRFERIRRRLLPYVWDGGRRPCDERIGRLCLWHGGEGDWEPVPDPPDLVEARDELLTTLAGAADYVPADEWILGQRIRYLGEAGRWEDAVRLAGACGGAASSWCSALEGFALHGIGRYEAALEIFHRGLETMESEEARKWRDPSVLLDGKGSDVLEDAADEDEWEAARARVWTLADPLYLVVGNDRESEHYARWTYSKMSDGARNAWAMRWGDDLEEIAVRYGWDRGLGTGPPGVRRGVRPSERDRASTAGWEGIRPSRAGSRDAGDNRARRLGSGREASAKYPRTRIRSHAPAGRRSGRVIPPRRFDRGGRPPPSCRRIPIRCQRALRPDHSQGLTSAPRDPIAWPQPALLDGPEQIGLFLVDEAGRVRGTSSNLREGALYLAVPAEKYLLSVEAWAPEKGLGGRLRHGIMTEALPDDLATLSDLILLHLPHPGDALPETLVSALPSMRSSTRLEANGQLVLGWEVFGLGGTREDVSLELSFYKEGESFFGRIGRWLGFGGREEPLQIEWSEPGPFAIGPWFRSVEVTIPEVDPGQYVFRLGVTARGREELVRTRVVEIVP